MAARILRLDPAHGSTVVLCQACGFRDLTTTLEAARQIAEDHRRRVHRRQQVQADSKRRRRALLALNT